MSNRSLVTARMNRMDNNRTVVVLGVPDVLLCERMADKLTIHFQLAKSKGGDVDKVHYPTSFRGVAFVTFGSPEDADRVVKYTQVMTDKEFPQDYTLTVFKYTSEVLFYVYAEVDLSIFSEFRRLIASLQTDHRSVHICPLEKGAMVSVEGPFTAVRALRQDLIERTQSVRGQGAQITSSREKHTKFVMTPKDSPVRSEEASVWVDTHIFTYIQTFHKDEYDRCLQRYDVCAIPLQKGDLTEVQIYSITKWSAVACARVELEQLVNSWQNLLETRQIDCAYLDQREKRRLLKTCEDALMVYGDVCYSPTDSHIEIIGPPSSALCFCELVMGRIEKMNHKYGVSSEGDWKLK
ncbi:RNA-binding protein 43 [Chanos chanos]|uniref:RNA-binding protein 43 n=1 Tax=Chanos chanos TaxID=29144 RepID=A0A6J2V8A5_CHACN|nr:RNA-binding protein 43 [Chanos chanos]